MPASSQRSAARAAYRVPEPFAECHIRIWKEISTPEKWCCANYQELAAVDDLLRFTPQ
jgi:hypothetical protein